MDLALDLNPDSATYFDISLDETGDLVTVDGAAGILQDVLTAIRVYQGEWFLDITVGMPYFQTIFVKNPDQALVNAAFIGQILAVPGVVSITQFAVVQDDTTRKPTITFKAQTIDGEVDYSSFLAG